MQVKVIENPSYNARFGRGPGQSLRGQGNWPLAVENELGQWRHLIGRRAPLGATVEVEWDDQHAVLVNGGAR